MGLEWYRARRCEKPITGFGWRGWIALAVFLGILIPELNGFSWQFFVLESVWRVWDWPVLFYAVPRMLPLTATLFAPEFGPLTVLPVLVAMQIVPVRFGRMWYVGLLLASFLVPYVFYLGYRSGCPLYSGGPEWFGSVVSLVLGAGCVWVGTRSRFLALVWFGMIPIAMLWGPYERSVVSGWLTIPLSKPLGNYTEWPLPGYAVFLLTGGAAVWWALHLRRELLTPGHCEACGYSLEGNKSGVCPECGAEMGERDGRARSLTVVAR